MTIPHSSLSAYPRVEYIGTDSKGLYYFWWVPNTGAAESGHELGRVNTNLQPVFAIADPWAKQVVFRILPKGAWTPPSKGDLLLGSYPAAVHPDGSIYIFDGDEKSRSYILKHLANNWWAELGFSEKAVGTVNSNRVRIRKKPSTTGEILAHVYEMEHALILEKSSAEETISGQKNFWYKVRLWDGREGWAFGAFLDIQK